MTGSTVSEVALVHTDVQAVAVAMNRTGDSNAGPDADESTEHSERLWPDVQLPPLHDSRTAHHPTAAAAADEVDLSDESVELPLLLARHDIHHSTTQLSSSTGASNDVAALRCLYASHCLARWAWRAWEFAVALILMKLFPSSLLLVSAYGLLDNLTRLMLGVFIGQYIDRTPRLAGAIACYGVQNLCIATSAAAAAALVFMNTQQQQQQQQAPLQTDQPKVYWLLVSVTMLAGASSSVGSLGAAVAVEASYPKVMCGADASALSKVNSVMRAIDLICQMLAPVASGFLMSSVSMLVAILVLAAYCLAVWLPECLLLIAAHRSSPALRQPKPSLSHSRPHKAHPLAILLGCSGWNVYFRQSTLLAGLALALLYLTVLSLGFLMTSYLVWSGLPESTVSLFRAAGALSGLSATVIFHPMQRCSGLVATGTVGIIWQLLCLLIGVVPVALQHIMAWPSGSLGWMLEAGHLPLRRISIILLTRSSGSSSSTAEADIAGRVMAAGLHSHMAAPVMYSRMLLQLNETATAANSAVGASMLDSTAAPTLLYVLLCGLVASRMGLWLFDLTVLQIQQESIPHQELGTVSGVQASIQSFFEILSFVAGLIAHRPQDFWVLMLGSCGSVAAAAGLYIAYACKGRQPLQNGTA